MPAWQPNWSDVRFDHMLAEAAVDELRRCAFLLDRQTERRAALARTAQQQWRGRARERFDDELARMIRQGADLVHALRRAAAAIERAADDARVEQRRREDDRTRWWDEKRAEDERRAEAVLPTPGPSRPQRVRMV